MGVSQDLAAAVTAVQQLESDLAAARTQLTQLEAQLAAALARIEELENSGPDPDPDPDPDPEPEPEPVPKTVAVQVQDDTATFTFSGFKAVRRARDGGNPKRDDGWSGPLDPPATSTQLTDLAAGTTYVASFTAEDGDVVNSTVVLAAAPDPDPEPEPEPEPEPQPGGQLGKAGARRTLAVLVISHGPPNHPVDAMAQNFASFENSIGRTVSKGDPLKFVIDNMGHFDRVPPRNAQWDFEIEKFINAWQARNGRAPVVQCQIMQHFGVADKGQMTPSLRVQMHRDIIAGKHDAAWLKGIRRLKAGFGTQYFIPRVAHEFELDNTTASWKMITQPGSRSHLDEMHQLAKDTTEHLARLWKSEGYTVSYVGDGGWDSSLQSRPGIGSLIEPYKSMPCWKFGLPDDMSVIDIFGTDAYASPTRSLGAWVNMWKNVQAVAQSLGKQWCIGEWGVYYAKSGQLSGFKDADVLAALKNLFETWMQTTPASGPGSCAFHAYFHLARGGTVNGQNIGNATELRAWFPQSWQWFRNYFGNP